MRIKFKIGVFFALWGGVLVSAQQITVPRIEKMPAMPQPYQMRDWKRVASDYSKFVFDEAKSGDHLPLVTRKTSGVNYSDCQPLYMDTYVGWNAHGRSSEAINVIPAVVTAAMFLDDDAVKNELAKSIADFFNRKNGENVYLNSFSSKSGNDWWYDMMPNVYFYQLYSLLPSASPYFQSQFTTVADRWLQSVYQLGGKIFPWTRPNMNYRAFDLISGRPLDSGVREPESAGSIAWILYRAYCETGDKRYLEGAQLAMEFLNSLTSNPSYELQLAYGVQAAARMNAVLGCNYDIEKMFNWCFDRGSLRGWGCIVGNWGGYDVSGLIGEANDRGNDYAFIMNGFQQMAALAPVPKYDKRFARAFARWAVNNANASGLFYRTGLPEKNQEATSYAWSSRYDSDAVIPYESMKEKWEGTSPLTMGDALRGGWAATNLSLYSGSSVGYLAAVIRETEVPGILQLDLNKTDFGNDDSFPTYLYYNPLGEAKQVTVNLPSGSYKIYDAIAEVFPVESASGTAQITIPADGVCLITLIPSGHEISQRGNKLYAGDKVIDYHYKYDYTPSLRIKSLAMQNSVVLKNSVVMVMAALENTVGTVSCEWLLNSESISGMAGEKIQLTVPAQVGEYNLTLVCRNNGQTATETVRFQVVEQFYTAPVIEGLTTADAMPVQTGAQLTVISHLKGTAVNTTFDWSVSAGQIAEIKNDTVAVWRLPNEEGIYQIGCKARNLMGESSKTLEVLVRNNTQQSDTPLLYFPFDGNLTDSTSGSLNFGMSDTPAYGEGAAGSFGSSLLLRGENVYASLPHSQELNFSGAVTIGLWIKPAQANGKEQFVLSHGSWQDRYKLSINPDMTFRWTIKTTDGIADVDFPVKLVPDQYIHATAVYTGFSAELYINGELVGYKPLNGSIGTTEKSFTLGAMNPEEMMYNYTGLIDELRIYDNFLSPDMIKKLPYLHPGASGVDDGRLEQVFFYSQDGKIYSSRQDIEQMEIYTLTGYRVANNNLALGIYIVRYVVEGRLLTVKVSVR